MDKHPSACESFRLKVGIGWPCSKIALFVFLLFQLRIDCFVPDNCGNRTEDRFLSSRHNPVRQEYHRRSAGNCVISIGFSLQLPFSAALLFVPLRNRYIVRQRRHTGERVMFLLPGIPALMINAVLLDCIHDCNKIFRFADMNTCPSGKYVSSAGCARFYQPPAVVCYFFDRAGGNERGR